MRDDTEELGSLSQSSRKETLKSARNTMYIVGVLTVLVNLGIALFAKGLVDSQFEKEIRELQAQGMQLDNQKVEELKKDALFQTQVVSGAFAVTGIIFIAMGAMIHVAPVPITVTALVLYIGCWGISALMDPSMLAKGIILKIIIIVALIKGVQAAIAYQREAAME